MKVVNRAAAYVSVSPIKDNKSKQPQSKPSSPGKVANRANIARGSIVENLPK